MPIIIIVIITEGFAQTMAIIQHRRYAVEAETVKLILVHPELAVRKEEMDDFVLPIIKTQRVPSRMFPPVARVEIQIVRAVETSQPFYFVLNRMAMNDIHNNRQAQTMCLVDQFLQFVRCTKAG